MVYFKIQISITMHFNISKIGQMHSIVERRLFLGFVDIDPILHLSLKHISIHIIFFINFIGLGSCLIYYLVLIFKRNNVYISIILFFFLFRLYIKWLHKKNQLLYKVIFYKRLGIMDNI